jgi:lipopolysaccharide transport system ATP-binding protein
MSAAIRIQNLSKVYQVDHEVPRGSQRYRTFREDMVAMATSPFRFARRMLKKREPGNDARHEDFWALRDVSFDIPQGEVVGIIGRNGAGKSTLLKILSRITPPSSGRIEINGRIGSLLEVGTGFHPELTGRENVFMNGSILGMSRNEISRKFDEIVAFSGVERFLDTPVKRYSSGMQVRLAFAVAAHLEPEVLIIDEVLAVGDAEFQQRCLSRMGEVARSGRTILFVSHNMAAIDGLCQRGIVLKAGQVDFVGNQVDATTHYLKALASAGEHARYDAPESARKSSKECYVTSARITSNGEHSTTGYSIGAPLEIRVQCVAAKPMAWPGLGIGLDSAIGDRIATFHSKHSPNDDSKKSVVREFEFVCKLASMPLVPGDYHVKLSLESAGRGIDVIDQCLRFTVLSTDYYRNGGKFGRGVVLCQNEWQLNA